MRNLSLLRTSHIPLPEGIASSSSIAAITLDLDEDAVFAAVERQSPDADVEVEIWKVSGAAKWEREQLEVREALSWLSEDFDILTRFYRIWRK
jgi:elongator complex protein 1